MNAKNRIDATARMVACLVVTSGLCTSARGQSVRIDDFDDGVDDGWVHTPWPYHDPSIPVTYDASSGAYHLGTSAPDPSGFLDAVISAWSASCGASAPWYSDGFYRAKVRVLNDSTDVSLAMRAADPLCAGRAYVFF